MDVGYAYEGRYDTSLGAALGWTLDSWYAWGWAYRCSLGAVVFGVMYPWNVKRNCKQIKTYYRPQRSCGKVIFSQVSVILFRGRVSASAHAAPPGRYTPGQVHPPARYTPLMTVTAADGAHPTETSCFWKQNWRGYFWVETTCQMELLNFSMGSSSTLGHHKCDFLCFAVTGWTFIHLPTPTQLLQWTSHVGDLN